MTDLTVIIPTYNERENIRPLIERIFNSWANDRPDLEILVVDDDSPDGTAAAAEELGKSYPVRVIKRTDKKGLGSAIVDGIRAARGEAIGVIDADLSHPPEALPKMHRLIREGKARLVVGSRKAAGGGTSDWIWYRKFIHWVARLLGSLLTPVRDLTSGYFLFDRQVVEGVELQAKSWKIGLEIMVKGKHQGKIVEYPIVFVEREAGQSKMGSREVFAYLGHLAALMLYKLKESRRKM